MEIVPRPIYFFSLEGEIGVEYIYIYIYAGLLSLVSGNLEFFLQTDQKRDSILLLARVNLNESNIIVSNS